MSLESLFFKKPINGVRLLLILSKLIEDPDFDENFQSDERRISRALLNDLFTLLSINSLADDPSETITDFFRLNKGLYDEVVIKYVSLFPEAIPSFMRIAEADPKLDFPLEEILLRWKRVHPKVFEIIVQDYHASLTSCLIEMLTPEILSLADNKLIMNFYFQNIFFEHAFERFSLFDLSSIVLFADPKTRQKFWKKINASNKFTRDDIIDFVRRLCCDNSILNFVEGFDHQHLHQVVNFIIEQEEEIPITDELSNSLKSLLKQS